jgi:hypothetical protein
MTPAFMLVPGPATANSAEVWAGIASLNGAPPTPTQAFVRTRVTARQIPIDRWNAWLTPNGTAGIHFIRIPVAGLAPRTRDRVELVVDGSAVAAAEITTLPAAVPGLDERPLTIMMGSCFCVAEDNAGRVGRAFADLPVPLRPDLKFLSGDQVYLDSPWYRYLLRRFKNTLANDFLSRYVTTWTQAGDVQGFSKVLSSGATFFSADDHEFWNNAPFPSFAANTLRPSDRDDWWNLAAGLYDAFQVPETEKAVRRVTIDGLEIITADTRVHRGRTRAEFMRPDELQELIGWIVNLRSPALLVVGQPIFAQSAGWRGRIADWNLPDFEQYGALARAIVQAPQPVVILTGDVHYGRIARAVTPRGVEILEVISSPMSLVTGGGGRAWHEPPRLFPAEAIPALPQLAIETVAAWKRASDHFLTLELWNQGNKLRLRIRSWETRPDPEAPAIPVYDHFVQRRP